MGVGIVYDERMCMHADPSDPEDHPEQPARIKSIMGCLLHQGLLQRCVKVEARVASDTELASVHSHQHIHLMKKVSSKQYGREGRKALARRYNSIYFNEGSSESALLAAGSVVEVSLQVAQGKIGAAAAVVRPPGHHAEADKAMGFCLFNNVAIAAHILVHQKPELGIRKALIVDWDIHHGNGTQHMFWNDPQILYFSVHRYDGATFYPNDEDGDLDKIGEGAGRGFNVNVPWPDSGFGDADYLAVWEYLLMPIAREFNPDIVFVSAGFDSAEGDPLGGCCLSPCGYYHMTHKLMGVAQGRIVMALEGGYNLDSTARCYSACVQALLGDAPLINENMQKLSRGTLVLLKQVCLELHQFWPVLSDAALLLDERMGNKEPTSNEIYALRSADEIGLTREDEPHVSDEDEINISEFTNHLPGASDIEDCSDLTKHISELTMECLETAEKKLSEIESPPATTGLEGPSTVCIQNSSELFIDIADISKKSVSSAVKIQDTSDNGREDGKTYVWYASYGSNMWKPRFLCYIQGGQVEGMLRSCTGSSDKDLPIHDEWLQVPHRLFFGRSYSATWGKGGVAFLKANKLEDHSTFVHLYKITLEQFNDLFMQENAAGTSDLKPDLKHLQVDTQLLETFQQSHASPKINTAVLIEDGWYGTILYLGEKDGCPILTFTCSPTQEEKFQASAIPMCPPSEAYCWAVARGLVEEMNFSKEDAKAYVLSKCS